MKRKSSILDCLREIMPSAMPIVRSCG